MPNAMHFVLKALPSIREGTLHLTLPTGEKRRYQGKQEGPTADLTMFNYRLANRFLTGGRLGACESYIDGDWTSSNLTDFFELITINANAFREVINGNTWTRLTSKIINMMNVNSKRGSRKNIYAHYDIGNDFYGQWLDKTMTYSSGIFENENDTLEQSHHNKYARITRELGLKKNDHILEIGCGWGGFAEHVATTIGCKVTAVTVSEAQYNYAKTRIKNAGLDHLVDIRLQDYRDITGQFDHIASIEMFEAVGEKYWPTFFGQIKSVLKPGGTALLQIITIKDEDFATYRTGGDYIQKYIFPGGMLPSKSVLANHIKDVDLIPDDQFAFALDYAKTLNLWNEKFQSAWPNIKDQKNMDERFKRMWEQYLCYCEAGFKTASIDVIHQKITN